MRVVLDCRNSIFVGALAVSLTVTALGQTGSAASQSSQVKAFVYDVVSVKPHSPGDRTMAFGPTPVGYHNVNVTLLLLIQSAYKLTLPDQIAGLPGWTSDARFDVEAKMDDATLAEFRKLPPEQQGEERRLMLQAVLAERFKLKVHHETREQTIYQLVVAKGGCKVKRSPDGEPQRMMTGNGKIILQAMPIGNVADNLSDEAGRIVVDKTGLTGNYDLTLKWTPEAQRTADNGGPSVYTALEEQLGLKLVPAKGPVNTIVIDQVERPSAN